MTGKTVLITGGTGGIGKYTAIGLAKQGATVIVTGRDEARGQIGVEEIKAKSGNQAVHLLLADLSKQSEIRRLADDFKKKFSKLDVLVNNVGLLEDHKRLTADGLEAHFAVNVVTPFLLIHELLDLLKQGSDPRVINLTGGMPLGKIDLLNLQAEKSFQGLTTYSHAKRVMSAMSLELSKRLEGVGISVHVVYPGAAGTAMTGAMSPSMLPLPMRVFWPVFKIVMRDNQGKSAEKASRSSVFAASSPELVGKTGLYLDTNSKTTKWPADIQNEQNRQAIWEKLESVTGVRGIPSLNPNAKAALKFV